MIDIRPFNSLGHANHGWLDARHHFSFANYHDPARMGWGRIRVWNDDTIGAKSGFPPHPHRDMEIVTYVRTGATRYWWRSEPDDQVAELPALSVAAATLASTRIGKASSCSGVPLARISNFPARSPRGNSRWPHDGAAPA
jgi:hypothetical protein